MTRTAAVPVQMTGLNRSFGEVRALDDFELEIRPGELIALLGPSGCGKTTALRVLAGLEEADSGVVRVGDRDITHVPANKRTMSMVFQSYSLFPHLTVAGNIDFALSMRKVPRSKRSAIIREQLELVSLGSQARRFPHELSGGQQQRVALARALASRPDVLLLDEPLSALDAKVRVQLRDQIRRIQLELGITTLFVTHDQAEALAIADRVGVMNSGRIEQLSAPQELYERPASEFVARFIGSANALLGKVSNSQVSVLDQWIPTLAGSVGQGPGTALVRPERIQLTTDLTGQGRLATIRQVSFLGDRASVVAVLEDGTELHSLVHTRDSDDLALGEQVKVTIDPAPVLVTG